MVNWQRNHLGLAENAPRSPERVVFALKYRVSSFLRPSISEEEPSEGITRSSYARKIDQTNSSSSTRDKRPAAKMDDKPPETKVSNQTQPQRKTSSAEDDSSECS